VIKQRESGFGKYARNASSQEALVISNTRSTDRHLATAKEVGTVLVIVSVHKSLPLHRCLPFCTPGKERVSNRQSSAFRPLPSPLAEGLHP